MNEKINLMKVECYDIIAQISTRQQEIQQLNNLLTEKQKALQKETPKEVKENE